ncbi:Fe-S cluster assembly protein HesB [Nocardioides solisilvae]|uniref:Fe-S cluster assembly protein HesB n=1 Tax=Nocardioides solisilvae TaxID=1542435 RepID=UPI000D74481B|nr:Fe-S cluster assembly protein HesB [Nocardioides solisilvae]
MTDIVKQLAREVPEVSGIRIAAEADGQSLSISPADHAQQDDQTIEQDGATVFVDAPASALLDDKVLDGGVDADGNIQFAVGLQA